MKKLLILALLPLLALAQTANVTKSTATNNLTAGFDVGPGQPITVESGGSFTVASGGTITLPDNALAVGDVASLQTALDDKLDDSQATATGLSVLGAADAAAARGAINAAKNDLSDAAQKSALAARLPGSTIVLVGDSLTDHNGYTSGFPAWSARGFFSWGNVLLGHRFRCLANLAVGGTSSTQIVATIPTALALNPSWVHYLAGTNDVDNGVPVATTIANALSAITQCRNAGVRIIIGTIPNLSGNTTTGRSNIAAYNLWLRRVAAALPGVVVVDYNRALSDPATGDVLADFTYDGVHPNTRGGQAMGFAFADRLRSLVPDLNLLSASSRDSRNLLANGVFAGTGGSVANLATGWTAGGSATYSKVLENSVEQWQRMVVANGSAANITQNVSIGASLAVGDVIIPSVRVRVSGLDSAPGAGELTRVNMLVQFWNGSAFLLSRSADLFTAAAMENFSARSWEGVLEGNPLAVPATTTLIQIVLTCQGGGTVDWAQATIINQTTAQP